MLKLVQDPSLSAKSSDFSLLFFLFLVNTACDLSRSLFCLGRRKMLFCLGIQKKREVHRWTSLVPLDILFFELFLGRFSKDLGIERDYNRTKSNGGRNREESKK